jgi:uncharacterized membrane protein
MNSDWLATLGILLRFVHVLAAIMWIGNSLLFTWMELSLVRPRKGRDPDDLLGTLDMLHGGGVFHLEKRVLHPGAIPERLHWFKWQSYTTWLTGFALLAAVFYAGQGGALLDTSKSSLPGNAAILLSLAGLAGGWLIYNALWNSALKNHPLCGVTISLAGLIAAAAFYNQFFNGRAVYLQIGAMMGTLMSANVFFHIMTNQRRFMAALRAGKPHDLELGKQAKRRSLHNHYLTFPVLFLMLSAHFPQLYGADWNVAALAVIVTALMLVKHLMNTRHHDVNWLPALGCTVFSAIGILSVILTLPPAIQAAGWGRPPAPAEAGRRLFVSQGCAACHMEGSSQIAPSLAGLHGHEQILESGESVMVDDGFIRTAILDPQKQVARGFAPAMPSFRGRLTDAELDELVSYIRSLGGQPSP